MTEYCSHWYPRYIILKRKLSPNFILVDNYLGHSSEEYNSVIDAVNGSLSTDYSVSSDLGNLEYIVPIAESDVPFTKQTNPELFV